MPSFRRVTKYVREHGILALLQAAVRRFVFHHCKHILISRPLDNPVSEIQLPCHTRIRKATLADVGKLHQSIKAHYSRSKQELRQWIAKGYPFFLAEARGRIIGYTYVSLDIPVNDPVVSAINFKADDAWGRDAFVLPAHRRRGIYPALAMETMKCARDAGCGRILATVRADNHCARAAHRKVGYQEIAEITFTRILFFKRTDVKRLKEASLDGQNS